MPTTASRPRRPYLLHATPARRPARTISKIAVLIASTALLAALVAAGAVLALVMLAGTVGS